MTFTIGPSEDGTATGNDVQIAALLKERDGYIARGLGDRVTEVEDVLERLGFERVERADVKPKAERATKPKG